MPSLLRLVRLGRVSRSYQGRLPRSFLVRNQSSQSKEQKSSDAPWALGGLGLLAGGFYWLLSPAVDEIAKASHKSHDILPQGGIAKKAKEELKDVKNKIEDKVSEKSNALDDFYQQSKEKKDEILKKGEELKKNILEKGFEKKDEVLKNGEEFKNNVLEKSYEKKDEVLKKGEELKRNFFETSNEKKDEVLQKGEELKKNVFDKGNKMKNEALEKGKEVKKNVLEKGHGVVDSAYEQIDNTKKQVGDTAQGYKSTVTELSEKTAQYVEDLKEKASSLIQSAEEKSKKPQTSNDKISIQANDTLNKVVDQAEYLIGKDNVQSIKNIASDAQSKLGEYQKEATKLIPSSVDEFTSKVSESLPSKSEVSSQIDEVASTAKAKANEAVEYVKDKVQK